MRTKRLFIAAPFMVAAIFVSQVSAQRNPIRPISIQQGAGSVTHTLKKYESQSYFFQIGKGDKVTTLEIRDSPRNASKGCVQFNAMFHSPLGMTSRNGDIVTVPLENRCATPAIFTLVIKLN